MRIGRRERMQGSQQTSRVRQPAPCVGTRCMVPAKQGFARRSLSQLSLKGHDLIDELLEKIVGGLAKDGVGRDDDDGAAESVGTHA